MNEVTKSHLNRLSSGAGSNKRGGQHSSRRVTKFSTSEDNLRCRLSCDLPKEMAPRSRWYRGATHMKGLYPGAQVRVKGNSV